MKQDWTGFRVDGPQDFTWLALTQPALYVLLWEGGQLIGILMGVHSVLSGTLLQSVKAVEKWFQLIPKLKWCWWAGFRFISSQFSAPGKLVWCSCCWGDIVICHWILILAFKMSFFMVHFAVLRAAPSLSLKAFGFCLRLSYVRGNPWFGAGILNNFFWLEISLQN